jgi:3-oxoacyl-[acyl-carrier protein] reductase
LLQTLLNAGSTIWTWRRKKRNQIGRIAVTPEHFAGLIAFLSTDDAELITGQMILCDGGGYLH